MTIDALFGRNAASQKPVSLPWEDDNTLRAVLFVGHTLVDGHEVAEKIEFVYEGPALNIQSSFSVICDHVQGNITAGRDITCDDVFGNAYAGRDITSDCIDGSASAGRDIHCDEICGSTVTAGLNIYCDHMDI